MRLIKPNARAAVVSLEEIFAARYDWLLKWALHFADGNHATAEDMVQDTFVRFIVAQPDVKDPEKAEPLLYTYLKYVHLAHQRRTRRHLLHHLTIVDFDSIPLAVRETPGVDAIDIQDDLRRVAAYLSWRKETAKSASILILRFLHGYRREEIMRVALISKQALANGLLLARDEAKRYLDDAGSMRVLHQSAPPDPLPRQIAVPLEQLLVELRSVIFDSCQTSCLAKDDLLQHYTRLNPKPLDTVLLAHIVSCKRCLDHINNFHRMPRLDMRSPEEAAATTRQMKPESRKRRPEPKLVIGKAYQRLSELYDHRPASISIAVNGHILAARDISSASNQLEVEVHPETRIEFIEVISEQGICLLAVPVVSEPPRTEPEIRHEASLGEGCKLELLVKFTANGPLIEVLYHDESLVPELEQEHVEDAAWVSIPHEAVPSLLTKTNWQARLSRRLQRIFTPSLNPIFTSAVILFVASIVCFGIWWTTRLQLKPHDVLAQAAKWDAGVPGSNQPGVIYQKIRVRTTTQTIERSVYRDAQSKRHMKPQPLTPNLDQLRAQLQGAGVPWNEPLSASSYQTWHDHQAIRQDHLVRSGVNLLTLTTTVEGGDIAQESLIVRESDFHPVGRSIAFRETGTVEIAELNYDVMPWGAVNQDWFEPLTAQAVSDVPMHAAIHLPHMLSELELDEAELAVRVTLHQLHADAGEPVQVTRKPDGIDIKGVVDTDVRKLELVSHLAALPHVHPAILSAEEIGTRSPLQSTVGNEQPLQVHSVEAQPSPLEQYLHEMKLPAEQLASISHELLDSSLRISQAAVHFSELAPRFPNANQLPADKQSQLANLAHSYLATIETELDGNQRILGELGFKNTATPELTASDADINEQIRHYRQLCRELIINGNGQSRPVDAITAELIEADQRIRQHLAKLSAAVPKVSN